MKTLTAKQTKALKYICEFIASKGYSPSLAEIATEGLGSKYHNSGVKIVLGLKYRGYIEYTAGTSRSIVVLIPHEGFGKMPRWMRMALARNGFRSCVEVIDYLTRVGSLEEFEYLGPKKAGQIYSWLTRGLEYKD